MLTNQQINDIYKELIDDGTEGITGALAAMWSETFWDDRVDNISEEEYNEVVLIHKRHREQLVLGLLKKYSHQ